MGRTKGAKNLPWTDMIARLRKYPGRWILLPEMRNVDYQMVRIIRERRRPALQMDDGKVYCRVKAIVETDDGKIRCTIITKFIPHENKKEAQ